MFSWLDSGYAAPTGICRSDKVSFSGYRIPRHMMCICPLLRTLIWIVRSTCFCFLHSLVYCFSPCCYSTVCDETLWEHADSSLLIQPISTNIVPCDVSCLNQSLLQWLQMIFFHPITPSTFISLHTNLRKCHHFSSVYVCISYFIQWVTIHWHAHLFWWSSCLQL